MSVHGEPVLMVETVTGFGGCVARVKGEVKGQAEFRGGVRMAADFDVFLNYNTVQL